MDLLVSTLLGLSAGFDFRDRRIPNRLILIGYLLGGVYRVYAIRSGMGLAYFLRDALIPIAMLFLLFRARVLGAGDIKLFSVLFGFIGFKEGLRVMVAAFSIGAMAALMKLLAHREIEAAFCTAFSYIRETVSSGEIRAYPKERRSEQSTIHFAAVIAAAYLLEMGRSYFAKN